MVSKKCLSLTISSQPTGCIDQYLTRFSKTTSPMSSSLVKVLLPLDRCTIDTHPTCTYSTYDSTNSKLFLAHRSTPAVTRNRSIQLIQSWRVKWGRVQWRWIGATERCHNILTTLHKTNQYTYAGNLHLWPFWFLVNHQVAEELPAGTHHSIQEPLCQSCLLASPEPLVRD